MDESAAAAPPFKTLAEMDGPKGLPLVGNLPQIDLPRFHQQLEAWCDEFGPIFKIRIGRRTRIVIADVEIANHMLRERPDLYRRNRNVERVIGEMGFNKAFLPFGTGPRFCPGRNLAIVEIKVVLAMLCRNFEIELADPDLAVEEELSFTMMPTNLAVKFKRRLQ